MQNDIHNINSNIEICGISSLLTKSHNSNTQIISQLWKDFNHQIHKIRNRPNPGKDWGKYGITIRENDKLYYMCALPFLNEMTLPDNMKNGNIPKGQYVVFTHDGAMSNLKHSYNKIYKQILPTVENFQNYKNKSGLLHFEKYDRRFNWNNSNSVIEIYVPIGI